MKQINPEDYRIFECITGSKLYGTDTPESDIDYRGVFVPPRETLLDPFTPLEIKDSGFEEEDRSLYSLGKFFKLCAEANPNIVELLFVPEEFRVFDSDIWNLIVQNRNLFLSKKIKYTFTGYSVAQLKAIIRHREWFINPPDHKPTRKEYGLTDSPLVAEANLQNALSLPNFLYKEEYQNEMQREREYREVKKRWDNYQQWDKNRNPKRKASEEKIGFDGKCASHLFRLMLEGKRLLLDQDLQFPLPEANWLLSIKDGFYSYEEVLDMAKNMESEFETWYEESSLPNKPDINGIKDLYFEIIEDVL